MGSFQAREPVRRLNSIGKEVGKDAASELEQWRWGLQSDLRD